jgi:hypothetical protein
MIAGRLFYNYKPSRTMLYCVTPQHSALAACERGKASEIGQSEHTIGALKPRTPSASVRLSPEFIGHMVEEHLTPQSVPLI